ncbi:hypothetical protein [Salinimicrobium sp. HB62]|uniref:hypothetical protein n=1 Tax=Salinimicrobium sp. HB62 TaxID=3077781 RepID=UPI002D7681F5|nr:hypothetical protein [Salinimicrobium sp. HB62]
MRKCTALFVFCFLILVSCSKEELNEELQETSQEDLNAGNEVVSSQGYFGKSDFLTSNFLPTFTNYFGRDRGTATYKSASLASEWVHEYDDKGNLLRSFFYELYPYRLLKEINYLKAENGKLKYEVTNFSYYGLIYSNTREEVLFYDDKLNIIRLNENLSVEETSDEGWITKLSYGQDGNIAYQTGYEYDEQGNVLKYLSYDITGTHYATVDYTYNQNGDPLSYHFYNIYGAYNKVTYLYGGNKTLERQEEEYFNDDADFGTRTFIYTPEERISTRTSINSGDGTKEVVTYTDDQIIVENYENDVLVCINIYKILEYGYIIELYKEYVDGVLYKIEYYDAEGELDYTEYYDESGNLIDTVYE